MIAKIKPYMMPIAIAIGCLCYQWLDDVSFLTPYLIGLMLFFTFANMNYKAMKLSKFHIILLAIQLLSTIVSYIILYPINTILAQGAMICFLAPTASAAPVIAQMLGGNLESLTTYSLLCNIVIAILAPIFFSATGEVAQLDFFATTLIIFKKISLLVFRPLVVAFLLHIISPQLEVKIKKLKIMSFYLWVIALIIISGNLVHTLLNFHGNGIIVLYLVLLSIVACFIQFTLGKIIGKKYGDMISGGQALGQKNTILAIWMAQSFLNPVAAFAPGAYILFQNLFNSYQMWKYKKMN